MNLAEELRVTADKVCAEKPGIELKKLLEQIKLAANEGRYDIVLPIFCTENIKELKKYGFLVIKQEQREYLFYIYWNKYCLRTDCPYCRRFVEPVYSTDVEKGITQCSYIYCAKGSHKEPLFKNARGELVRTEYCWGKG